MSEGIVYRNIVLPNDVKAGDVLQIKFDTEGVVYDLFDNSMEELKEEYGYDFYSDIEALNQNKDEIVDRTADIDEDMPGEFVKIKEENQNKEDE